jgi:hypothetical protein
MEWTAGRSGSQPAQLGHPDYEVCWPPGAGVACIDLWSPAGPALDQLGSELTELAEREPVLVDLGHAEPIEAECVRRLAGAVARGRPGRVAVVCPQRDARVELQAIGVERLAPVFASRGDALQARTMYLAGFGPGWLPAPSVRHHPRPVRPFAGRTVRWPEHRRPA